ncbi:hypothetical protein FACS1894122_01740 [Alphaproteobacteria bacterium]|nr:hypothetical protein FACS1894122_01740 [Alphaproteobacteria bacterium]
MKKLICSACVMIMMSSTPFEVCGMQKVVDPKKHVDTPKGHINAPKKQFRIPTTEDDPWLNRLFWDKENERGSRNFLASAEGQKWLVSPIGKKWLKTPCGKKWSATQEQPPQPSQEQPPQPSQEQPPQQEDGEEDVQV